METNTARLKHPFAPFVLTALILAADQAAKAWVVATIPRDTIHARYFGDFLWIVHVRNSAIGFSIGSSLPDPIKRLLFVLVPTLLMIAMMVYIVRSKELSRYQRVLLAGIVGGGLGNVIDRMFRSEWVVDFISVRIYGLFGMDRWPTFNIADSALVVTGVLLMLNIIFSRHPESNDGTDPVVNQAGKESVHE